RVHILDHTGHHWRPGAPGGGGSMRYRVLGVVASLVIAAACSGTSPSAPDGSPSAPAGEDWQAGAGEEWESILAAAREEGSVVIGGPAFLAEAMAEAFERDTGIALEWIGASGSELSARMQQEVAAGNVTMDGKLGGAQELFVEYKEILEPIAPKLILPGVTDGSNWRHDGVDWYDPDEQYMLKGSEYVFGWPV